LRYGPQLTAINLADSRFRGRKATRRYFSLAVLES